MILIIVECLSLNWDDPPYSGMIVYKLGGFSLQLDISSNWDDSQYGWMILIKMG